MQHTAEFVSPLHPDKICDRIADKILDEYLNKDPLARVAVEVMAGHDYIYICGEISSPAKINIKKTIKQVSGVNNEKIILNIHQQSPSIAQGVDNGGAGDQGIMIGYACNENSFLIPQEYYLARDLCQTIFALYPADGKTQITINNNLITDVVASWQGLDKEELNRIVQEWLKNKACAPKVSFYINESGDWGIGGLQADTGLTGRKIVVDSYGPRVMVGGGSLAGKDATKVDRSGAYLTRHLAIKYLKQYQAKEVIIKIAYVIGKAEPIMLAAIIDGQEINLSDKILTVQETIKKFSLTKPIYSQTSTWGAFGNNFVWEIDK